MSANRILAFSSSRVGNSRYLEMAAPIIKDFIGDALLNIAFIPFASVNAGYEDYTMMVQKGLGVPNYLLKTVLPVNAHEVIENADAILVGGGNTFKLLHDIYECKLLDIIRDKVNNGTPYIGWSAGSNILSPTIGTTNDMPVIEPKSFNALGLFPFQLNPHYTNAKIDGHNGETRDQRLEEFISLNPGLAVVGLPEGTVLKLENRVLTYLGPFAGVILHRDDKTGELCRQAVTNNQDLSFLF